MAAQVHRLTQAECSWEPIIQEYNLSEEAKKLQRDLAVRLTQVLEPRGFSLFIHLIVAYASNPYVERPRFRVSQQGDMGSFTILFCNKKEGNRDVMRALWQPYYRAYDYGKVSIHNLEDRAAEDLKVKSGEAEERFLSQAFGYDGENRFVFVDTFGDCNWIDGTPPVHEAVLDELVVQVAERRSTTSEELEWVTPRARLIKSGPQEERRWERGKREVVISYDRLTESFLILTPQLGIDALFFLGASGSHAPMTIPFGERNVTFAAGVDYGTLVAVGKKQLYLIRNFRIGENPRFIEGPRVDSNYETYDAAIMDPSHRNVFVASTLRWGSLVVQESIKMFALPDMHLQRSFLLPYSEEASYICMQANDTILVACREDNCTLYFWDIASGAVLSTIEFEDNYPCKCIYLTNSQFIYCFSIEYPLDVMIVYDFFEDNEQQKDITGVNTGVNHGSSGCVEQLL